MFSDTLGRYDAVVIGLSLGVGTKHQEIREKLSRCLRHPMDDTALLDRPLHGRGHRSATLSRVFRHAKDTQSRSLLERGHSVQMREALLNTMEGSPGSNARSMTEEAKIDASM